VDLRALEQFQAVARLESVSVAARQLRIAQPALSRTIGRLENELGVPLFDRSGRGIQLNRFGRAYLRHVDAALAALADGRQELHDTAGLDRGEIAVAAEHLALLHPVLAGFRDQYPEVSIRLHQASLPDMARQLDTGAVDLCVASQPMPGPDRQATVLRRERVLLALPPGHPLTGRTRLPVTAFTDEPVVTTRPGYWPRALLDRLFAEARREPRIVSEADEPGVLRELVALGIGVTLLPEGPPAGDPGLSWATLASKASTRTLTLVRNPRRYVSAAARQFEAALTEQLGGVTA
jgi:DNA-binding transcriptional LysR family regulator